MNPVPVICIDGPSGAGKGTVSRVLAAELGWHFLDSGALYRVLAIVAEEAAVALTQVERLVALAQGLELTFDGDAMAERILLRGEDITSRVRAEATGERASRLAAHPPVREALLERQRGFRLPPGLVADGRDMGTVVFPDAVLKLFLVASPEERARRRAKQLSQLGLDANVLQLTAGIRARDERDRTRCAAPLQPAEDAQVVDSTTLDIPEVMSQVRALAAQRGLIRRDPRART